LKKFPEKQKRLYIDCVSAIADRVFVTDPEIATYIPEPIIIERAVDLNIWKNIGISLNTCPLVVHAPSSQIVKGTETILSAVSELKKRGLCFEFKLIENLSNHEARKIYEAADIVVDQLRIGWYGVLAVECMALGKPVVSYIRDDLVQVFKNELPLANANLDNIQDVLRELIESFDVRQQISLRARSYVEKVHDADIVAQKLYNEYREIYNYSKSVDPLPLINLFSIQVQQRKAGRQLTWVEILRKILKEAKAIYMKEGLIQVTRGFFRLVKTFFRKI
jgi:glycosyltransferase involved in cell wall biosynthesis